MVGVIQLMKLLFVCGKKNPNSHQTDSRTWRYVEYHENTYFYLVFIP